MPQNVAGDGLYDDDKFNLMWTGGFSTVHLSGAPSFGKSVLEHDSNGTGARAYRALAKEFIQRHGSL
jgi:cellulose biosynthesis protein BcsQ